MLKPVAILSLAFGLIGVAASIDRASAQSPSPSPPYVYPATIGTAPTQIIGANQQRRRIIFFNPNAQAVVAYCPVGPARNGVAFSCAVNGPGSITLIPYSSFVIDGGTPSGPPLSMGGAWNAVADTAGSKFTALEFE